MAERGISSTVADGIDTDPNLESEIFARHVEVKNLNELAGKENQRSTPIPALFNQFYKFIQNPSTVSVETFKRMVDTDDTIGSGVDFLTVCMAARLGRYQHKSKEITQWVNAALERVEGGIFAVVKEILSATWAGFSVSEIVWANTSHGFVPEKIVTLPPATLLFETDRLGEITPDGILQYQRNYNPIALSSGIGFYGGAVSAFGFNVGLVRPDLFAKFGDLPFPLRTANMYNYLSIRIPRVKCLHYAFDAQGKFGNPYGRSLLRRAYKYYVMKDAFLQMMSVALDRKGTPLTIVYYDPNTTLIDDQKASPKSVAKDSRGARAKSVGISAGTAASRAFERIHNDTTIFLPGMKGKIFETDFVPQDSNTEAFIAALDFCNKSILRALLIPTLIFGNGDGTGSYSLGQEHAKTFDKILDGSNCGLKYVLIQQLIRQMIAYNFPKSAWERDGFGDFGKREMSQEEIDKIAETYEKGINMGVIDTNDLNDLNKMRDTMGFEERETPIEKQHSAFGFGGEDEESPLRPEGTEGGKPEDGEAGISGPSSVASEEDRVDEEETE